MLIELRIKNYAIIEQISLRLEPGLNVLTGETGAGKSIIVGALSLLLGERATSDVVREGTERASVEGVFDVAGRANVHALLAEQGIETEDDLLILRREVAAEGRNRAWVNGSAATASFVGELGRALVDLHGQHESQTLLEATSQRDILDAFARAGDLRDRVARAHAAVVTARRQLDDLERRRREAEQRADFLRFQRDEIESAHVKPGEDTEIDDELRRLTHAEELTRLARQLHAGLYGGERSITSQLGELRRALAHLVRIDPSQSEITELLDSALFTIEDLGQRAGDYAESIDHDPARLEHLQRRQDLLFRLKSKYGPEIVDVVESGKRAAAELDLLDRSTFEKRELAHALESAGEELTGGASRLSQQRKAAAKKLEQEVAGVLPDVALDGARFEVALTPLEQPGAAGAEEVEFRIAVNAGFDPKPIARIASGGELSRVMLALKTILADVDSVPTLVFDEVDVGIGGRVALRVGDKLRAVASSRQVFVITHLAQIASRADHQLLVEKVEQEGSTITRVHELSDDDRVRELARMLGGDPESQTSVNHARELVQRTRKS